SPGHTRRTQGVMIAVALILIGGIPRGTGLQCVVIRQGPTGDHQPRRGSGPFALDPRLHPAPDQLDLHRPFLAVSYRQGRPRLARECLAPICHRLPRGFRAPSTPCIRGQRGLKIAHRRGARPPQDIPLSPLAALVAKLRVATPFIIAGDPAVWHLIPPRVEHLQTLFLSRLIAYLQRHVACLASLLVPCPVCAQGQAEVEQGMVVLTDVAHEHADLAVIDFAAVAAPLPFDAHRMRAAFGETAGIESEDAIRFAQSIGHLTNQHLEQRSMLPWGGTDEVLHDLSLAIYPPREC